MGVPVVGMVFVESSYKPYVHAECLRGSFAVRRDSGHLRLARVGVEARGAKGSFSRHLSADMRTCADVRFSIVSLGGFSMRNNGKSLRRGHRLRTGGLGRSLQHPAQVFENIQRQREDDGGVLLHADFGQRLQVAELDADRLGGQ
jgi:hypothetical protein